MKQKIKSKAIYLFVATVFIFFTSTLNIKSSKPPLLIQNTQQNLILLHTDKPIQDYISVDTGNSNTDTAVVWRDFLPETLIPTDIQKEKVIFDETIKYSEYKIDNYTILARYRERVLRI